MSALHNTTAAEKPLEATPEHGADRAQSSMLGALVIVARQRGIHLSQAHLRRDHQIGPGEPSPQALLQIARTSGMRVVKTRLEFRDLMRDLRFLCIGTR
jgi:ABC-type bacteriocin/lantibiotic exporter with double-glycine peptidase domain